MDSISCETIARARKVHLCDWCNESIEVGESYVRQRNKDGRDVWTWREHLECSRAAETLSADDLENSVGIVFSRGCTCESGGHDAGSRWPCDLTPWTQATAREAADG